VWLCRAFGLALVFWACGGKVEPDDGHGGSGGAPATGGAAGRGEGGHFGDPTPLEACELGFSPQEQPARRCPWIADGRCYETKEKACACICPVDRVTTCISGFPGDGPVFVDCV
jgi:hypothetical protein